MLEVGGGEDAGDDVLRDAEAAEVVLPAALVDITRMRRRNKIVNTETSKVGKMRLTARRFSDMKQHTAHSPEALSL